MERTKIVGQIQWKNTGGGTLVLRDHRTIKPGQTFFALPNEVPKAFQDTIKALEPTPAEIEPIPIKVKYSILKRAGTNWYNVLDMNKKVVNEKALKRTEALALIKTLEG